MKVNVGKQQWSKLWGSLSVEKWMKHCRTYFTSVSSCLISGSLEAQSSCTVWTWAWHHRRHFVLFFSAVYLTNDVSDETPPLYVHNCDPRSLALLVKQQLSEAIQSCQDSEATPQACVQPWDWPLTSFALQVQDVLAENLLLHSSEQSFFLYVFLSIFVKHMLCLYLWRFSVIQSY